MPNGSKGDNEEGEGQKEEGNEGRVVMVGRDVGGEVRDVSHAAELEDFFENAPIALHCEYDLFLFETFGCSVDGEENWSVGLSECVRNARFPNVGYGEDQNWKSLRLHIEKSEHIYRNDKKRTILNVYFSQRQG